MKLSLITSSILVGATTFFLSACNSSSLSSDYLPGTLDTTFNSTGIVTHNNAAGANGDDIGNAIKIASNGKIYVAGQSFGSQDGNPTGYNPHMALWSYNTDGTLNTEFGSGNGFITENNTAGGDRVDIGYDLFISSDDKIYVAGTSVKVWSSDYDMVIWSYDLDGNPNTDFSGDGIAIHAAAGGSDDYGDKGFALTIANDKLYITGQSWGGRTPNDNWYDMAMWSYNLDGTLNKDFSTDGFLAYNHVGNYESGNAIAVNNDKIYVAGTTNNGSDSDMTLWSYDLNGAANTSFGGGIVTHHNAAGGDSGDYGNAIAIDSDGYIYVAGQSNNGSKYDIVVWKYDTTGNLETNFGDNGIAIYSSPSNINLSAKSIVLDQSGNIVITATENEGGGDTKMITVMLDNTGNIASSTFGTDGYFEQDTPVGSSGGYGLVLNSDESSLYITGKVPNDDTSSEPDMAIWKLHY